MQPPRVAPVRSEINVTPLVDVVLVLLIIFMVVTPMLSKGPSVKLPSTNDPPKKPDTHDQLLITVRDNEDVFVENNNVSVSGLAGALQDAYRQNPSRTVVIKADGSCPYGGVKRAMLGVKDAGFQGVGLIVEKVRQ